MLQKRIVTTILDLIIVTVYILLIQEKKYAALRIVLIIKNDINHHVQRLSKTVMYIQIANHGILAMIIIIPVINIIMARMVRIICKHTVIMFQQN